MTLQVMDVAKPLGSVNWMVQGGTTVVLTNRVNCITNDRTGETMEMIERTGSYEVDLWCKRREEMSKPDQAGPVQTHNRFQALSEESNFARRGN